jgi:hypothetical protein
MWKIYDTRTYLNAVHLDKRKSPFVISHGLMDFIAGGRCDFFHLLRRGPRMRRVHNVSDPLKPSSLCSSVSLSSLPEMIADCQNQMTGFYAAPPALCDAERAVRS